MTEDREPTFLGPTISRRFMLGTSVAFGGMAFAACTPTQERYIPGEANVLAPDRDPTPPGDLQLEEGYVFFTEEEAGTVEAIVARIIPGDDEDPGAIQAGVPAYIDRQLEGFEAFAEPTYREGPFAQGYQEGEEPPTGGDIVPVPAQELNRYGFQSELTPQQLYRAGLAGVDRLAQTRYGSLFVDLDEDTQDELLMVLEGVQQRSGGADETGSALSTRDVPEDVVGNGDDGDGGGQDNGNGGDNGEDGNGNDPTDAEMDQAEDLFGQADPGEFFGTVRTHTIEGMFSDPVYGGNRNLVGWTMIGWPGAQRSYSPDEMLNGTDKQPTSMEGLTPMNPDRYDGGREAIEKPRDGVHSH